MLVKENKKFDSPPIAIKLIFNITAAAAFKQENITVDEIARLYKKYKKYICAISFLFIFIYLFNLNLSGQI